MCSEKQDADDSYTKGIKDNSIVFVELQVLPVRPIYEDPLMLLDLLLGKDKEAELRRPSIG